MVSFLPWIFCNQESVSSHLVAYSFVIHIHAAVDRCAISFATSALWYLQQGEIDKAIERCDYVIDHILPHYDKKDVLGLYTILIQLIRVLKWNNQVDKARAVYNENIPEGVENHFAVGSLHKPMCLLLEICEGSSEQYNSENMLDDINLALSFDMSDITDYVHTCECWSMKSLVAEVCLHLARRRKAGDTVRESLIDKGTEMSTIANQRVISSNGLVKHILAYEANKEVRKRLRELADEQDHVNRKIIYDCSDNCSRIHNSDSENSTALSLAHRLNVKDDSSKTNSNGSGGTASAPTSTNI